jgi:hypothetical protein
MNDDAAPSVTGINRDSTSGKKTRSVIIGLLGGLIFIGALVALVVNNINTPKNPKPVTPEEKRKRTERDLAIGTVGLGALWAGVYALERANRRGMPGWDLRPSGSSPVPADVVRQEWQQCQQAQQHQALQQALQQPVFFPGMVPPQIRNAPG